MELFFIVDEEAQGKARPRFWGGHAVTPKRTRDFETRIRIQAKMAMIKHSVQSTAKPVRIHVNAAFQVPKSYTKSFKRLVDSKPVPHDKKPDADNVLKAVCDALNGVAYVDDKQVYSASCEKLYTNSESYFSVFVTDEEPEMSKIAGNP